MQNIKCPLVALVGRPNVGKSSLFNRITRSNKAIVDPTPGVTRDRHYEKVVCDDKTFMLVDTGGIESGDSDKMADLIREQSWQAIAEADVILFMLDGKEGVMPEDYEVVSLLRKSGKTVYYLVNKIDGPEQEQLLLSPFYELGIEQLWPVSAAHGYGVSTFLDELTGNLPTLQQQIDLPAQTISVAFIGRPNVGKSSLINKLVGEDRMVVSEIAGTTRDSVDALLSKNNKNYLLIDTAGIRRKGKVREKIEKFSVMRALNSMERCDIALILLDASEGITDQDTKVIGYGLERGLACIILVNKWDLIKNDKKRQKFLLEEVDRATNFVGFAPVLTISALTGSGLNRILPTIDKVNRQYNQEFSTGQLNRILQDAVEAHSPSLHNGRRIKFYYTTQVATKPPTFVLFVNYPKGVHFSYHRYLTNQFRSALGIDKSPIKLLLRERQRKKYG